MSINPSPSQHSNKRFSTLVNVRKTMRGRKPAVSANTLYKRETEHQFTQIPTHEIANEQSQQSKDLDLSAWEKDSCPHCASLVWTKRHRTWWQKMSKPKQNLCVCRECHQEFWREAF